LCSAHLVNDAVAAAAASPILLLLLLITAHQGGLPDVSQEVSQLSNLVLLLAAGNSDCHLHST
jgi:hypothetical protein